MRYTEALIEKVGTHERYTASQEIKDLVGPLLADFVFINIITYDTPTNDGIIAVNLAYKENRRDQPFLYIIVNWNDAKWASSKMKHNKDIQTIAKTEKVENLEERGLVELSAYDAMKKAQSDSIEAMVEHNGRVGKALKQSGVTMAQHLRWVKTDREYREAMEVIQEVVVDQAEELLLDLVEEGSESSAQFVLKNRGSSRGYGDQRKINETEEQEEENALPIEALTPAEQKTLERLVVKMENFKSKRVGVQ